MVTTTLKQLRGADACKERYAHLKKALGPKYGDDTPIDICFIAENNGVKDALWIPERILSGDNLDKRYRLFAVACCLDVLHLMNDIRSKNAVIAAHLFAHGEIGEKELAAARDAAWAAWAAARDAAAAEADAARAAARDAAAAARAAERDAAAAARKRQLEHFKIIFSADFDVE